MLSKIPFESACEGSDCSCVQMPSPPPHSSDTLPLTPLPPLPPTLPQPPPPPAMFSCTMRHLLRGTDCFKTRQFSSSSATIISADGPAISRENSLSLHNTHHTNTPSFTVSSPFVPILPPSAGTSSSPQSEKSSSPSPSSHSSPSLRSHPPPFPPPHPPLPHPPLPPLPPPPPLLLLMFYHSLRFQCFHQFLHQSTLLLPLPLPLIPKQKIPQHYSHTLIHQHYIHFFSFSSLPSQPTARKCSCYLTRGFLSIHLVGAAWNLDVIATLTNVSVIKAELNSNNEKASVSSNSSYHHHLRNLRILRILPFFHFF
ncbi:uncharacterized protein MONOS_15899 [Monocercomonoides exilis]|uniref:uncharacterized protein n=1 Tax=Monocercomonoides exilis TaxID=2049356 RepID=UPI003559BD83|nr:hypothetical protein MONOS_15899 [Monocercomonoides exilis]|eukprot:MONOS_15899.1-p1 / transcript=MONOS_15899.1 / gene=MONOS_15899 / organism=Monocercomonoides_exilis_PA203 / gene_product=unspecified product / transcript_product=unspecified product / location=Mono_scaffold01396:5528-6463(-) / protein_length=312 / sequence_SO=supercontig / SO=protein_coding / is_pseudo=false